MRRMYYHIETYVKMIPMITQSDIIITFRTGHKYDWNSIERIARMYTQLMEE